MTALFFAGLFLVMLVATQLAVTYLGSGGSEYPGRDHGSQRRGPVHHGPDAGGRHAVTPFKVAAAAVRIAASSNNIVKGFYAFSLADRKTGVQALVMLVTLAALGLIPLFWLG